jgi:hypothetical protein
MIVKTISKNDGEVRESYFECKRFHKTQSSKGITFHLEGDLDRDNIHLEINGETPRWIYIMNNEGKTIDYIPWNMKNLDK